MRKRIWRKGISRVFSLYIPLALFLIGALFPLYWMIITSIKSEREIASPSNPLWVYQPTLVHYQKLLTQSNYPIWYKNNLVIGFSSTFLSLLISSFAAYALARLRFPGRWLSSRFVLFTYLVPRTVLFIPLFTILQTLHLTDTVMGLIFTYLTFMIPFCTWLLIGYFRGVPLEVEECARIDGCNRLQTLLRITIPLALPGLITAALFSFTLSWNEFLYPLVFNTQSVEQVVPVGVSDLQMGDVIRWGQVMAAGSVYSLPLVFLYAFIQKFLVEGMTAGAVKG